MRWGIVGRSGLPGLCAAAALCAQTPVRLAGKILTETNEPLGGARLILRCGGASQQGASDPTGAFQFLAPPGACLLSAELESYFPLRERPVQIEAGGADVRLILTPRRERVETLDVTADAVALDFETPSSEQRLTNTELLNVPYPASNSLQSALRVLPGVVQGSRGELHLNGGAAEQTFHTLDSFNLSDPLTGRLETRLGVEAVDSVEVSSGALPAEFGKGSAGVLSLRAKSGDDRFRASATNFIPGIENRKGIIIGNFTPRVNFSGPWRRGRAWFSDSADLQYDQQVVKELPEGQDRTASWRWSNLLHNQINLSPSNILHSNFLATWWYAPRAGLGPLDPLETTVDRRARQYFFTIKDQVYFSRGALLEYGYAANRTSGREIPQGSGLFLLTAEGKRGNYFRNSDQHSSRDQFIAGAFLPAFQWRGGHQIKLGLDVNRLGYGQEISRTGYRYYRASGTELRETLFRGNGRLDLHNTEVSFYGQDSWKPRPGLTIEAGLRWDWDQILKRFNTAPRAGFAWSPAGMENLKFSGGVGMLYDATSLQLFVRPGDQYAVTTYFTPGGTPIDGPAASLFRPAVEALRAPGYLTYSAAVERRLPKSLWLRAGYVGKRGIEGFTYWNTIWGGAPAPAGLAEQLGVSHFDALYQLANRRQDRFDSFELTARQVFRGQYEWMASYIRSSTRSNAAVDVSIDEPVVIPNNSGPLAWDTPNRLISWGYLPTPWKNWAAAYLVEWRNGFPYSILDEGGQVAGAVNSQRFPAFFEANLHAERRLTLRGYVLAVRGGLNNITNRKNPTVVNGNLGAPNFGAYYGGFGRSLNFRIRWLGRR